MAVSRIITPHQDHLPTCHDSRVQNNEYFYPQNVFSFNSFLFIIDKSLATSNSILHTSHVSTYSKPTIIIIINNTNNSTNNNNNNSTNNNNSSNNNNTSARYFHQTAGFPFTCPQTEIKRSSSQF